MTLSHTPECQAQMDARLAEIAAWERQWPCHCATCHGDGRFTVWDDPSPAGVGLSPGRYSYAESCPDCTEWGICARCGAPSLTPDGEGPCTTCGWDYDDGCPAPPECCCPEPIPAPEWTGEPMM